MPGLCRYGLDCIMHGTESQYCTTIKCMLKKRIPVRECCRFTKLILDGLALHIEHFIRPDNLSVNPQQKFSSIRYRFFFL